MYTQVALEMAERYLSLGFLSGAVLTLRQALPSAREADKARLYATLRRAERALGVPERPGPDFTQIRWRGDDWEEWVHAGRTVSVLEGCVLVAVGLPGAAFTSRPMKACMSLLIQETSLVRFSVESATAKLRIAKDQR